MISMVVEASLREVNSGGKTYQDLPNHRQPVPQLLRPRLVQPPRLALAVQHHGRYRIASALGLEARRKRAVVRIAKHALRSAAISVAQRFSSDLKLNLHWGHRCYAQPAPAASPATRAQGPLGQR
jgi:hypothetical protein